MTPRISPLDIDYRVPTPKELDAEQARLTRELWLRRRDDPAVLEAGALADRLAWDEDTPMDVLRDIASRGHLVALSHNRRARLDPEIRGALLASGDSTVLLHLMIDADAVERGTLIFRLADNGVSPGYIHQVLHRRDPATVPRHVWEPHIERLASLAGDARGVLAEALALFPEAAADPRLSGAVLELPTGSRAPLWLLQSPALPPTEIGRMARTAMEAFPGPVLDLIGQDPRIRRELSASDLRPLLEDADPAVRQRAIAALGLFRAADPR